MGPNTHIRRQCDPYMYMKHPEPITHSKFLAMAEFLIKAAKVPVGGIGLDIKYAQIFLDAGASIHRRDRYGESTTREAAKVNHYNGTLSTSGVRAEIVRATRQICGHQRIGWMVV